MATVEELREINEQLTNKMTQIEQTLAQLQVHQAVEVRQQTIVQIPPPEKFTFEKEDWQNWLTTYNRYRVATALNRQTEQNQVTNLLLHMGSPVDRLLATLGKNPDEISSYKQATEIFSNHYVKKINIIYERAKFNMRNQREGETAQEFVADVIQLAKNCNYGQLHDDLVRDRLVVGIRDQKQAEMLQLDENLTLQKAIDKILQAETIKCQTNDIKNRNQNENHNIDSLRQRNTSKTSYFQGKRTNRKTVPEQTSSKKKAYPECRRCGAKPSHELKDCPATKARCKRCQIKGHFEKFCRTKNIREVEAESDEETKEFDFGETINRGKITGGNNKPWTITLKCSDEKQSIKFKLDTGADESLITKEQYNKLLRQNKIKPTNDKLYAVGNKILNVYGTTEIKIDWKNSTTTITAYVVDAKENLLGRPAINELKLVKWIESVETDACHYTERYPQLFKGLGHVKNKKYTIKVRNYATPFSIATPRRVPVPLLTKVKTELDRMVKAGVIEPVSEASEWCAPMVIAIKKSGDIRICADYTELNRHVLREKLVLPSVDETLSKLSKATVFSKLDASSGFWQVELSKESRQFTTFITPFGRFMYKRLPFGITSAPEVYQKIMNEMMEKLNGVLAHIDDIIIWGKDQQEHDENLEKVLETLQNNGITLNKNKCKISVTELKFLGHTIGKQGIQPNEELVTAIKNFPEPKNVKGVRQFLGMINHLTKFLKNAAEETKILRELLKKENEFIWTPTHQNCFDKLKKRITMKPVLAMYNINLETRVSADASSYGIGGVLEQKQQDGTWRPVVYCSKSLSDTEQRYAQIEKETLALTWTCERLQQYIIGKHFMLRTDHKPLTTILKTKPVNELTIRLQRMRMRLIRFDYDIEYVPGKEFCIPDALSRSPENIGQTDKDILFNEECNIYIDVITKILEDETKKKKTEIQDEQEKDGTLEKLKEYVKQGWPMKTKCDKSTLPFYAYRKEINIQKQILCYRDRIVIPKQIQKEMLNKIHNGHQGINRSLERAKTTMWWPNMRNHIMDTVQTCEQCAKHKNVQHEPLLNTKIPPIPWTTIGADLCEVEGRTYLIIQDYYSKFLEILSIEKTKSKDIINKMKSIFARFGIPAILRTDNGKQFDCYEFKQFSKDYKFKHTTSSPRYAQSNGFAERGVQTAKNIIKKCEDPFLGLLAYRNTPLPCGASPAQLMMGRQLRENFQVNEEKLKPKLPEHTKVYEYMKQEQNAQKYYYDRRHNAKHQTKVNENERVWIIDLKREGKVKRKADEPRSYIIETEKEKVRRNRRQITLLPNKLKRPVPTKTNPPEAKPRRKRAQPDKYKDYILK